MVRSCSDLDLSHVKAKVNSHWTKSEGVLGTRGMVNGSTASLREHYGDGVCMK